MKNITAEVAKFETVKVEGSDCRIYTILIEHETANDAEVEFKNALKEAISASVHDFEVFICDPSIDKNGKLQFVPGFIPAVGYSYAELENLAERNGLRLGNKFEYVLFLGTLINKLIVEGWSESEAWNAVCFDSKELGHYYNSVDAKHDFEPTGSRKIVGKCDFANTGKILAKDEKTGGFWLAGGCYFILGDTCPLASFSLDDRYDYRHKFYVGWFVR